MQMRECAGYWAIIGTAVVAAIYLFSNIRNESAWGMVGFWSVTAACALLFAYKVYLDMESYRIAIEAAGAVETPSL